MDKRRLGRGLEALLGGDAAVAEAPAETSELAIGKIVQNPSQPRKHFDPDELASLCASVRAHGILQPLVVRSVNGQFQLIAGERRLRAAQDAGLSTVPVRVVDFNDQQVLEAALVENIQRGDAILCYRCQSPVQTDAKQNNESGVTDYTFTCIRCFSWGRWVGKPELAKIGK